MINTRRFLKVSAVWVSIVYAVCFAGVALLPGVREGFMMYALHTDINMGRNVMTFGTFFSGLIIWNVITLLGVGLFAVLYNAIRN